MIKKGLTVSKLYSFTKGSRSSKGVDVNEILGWLLNITLALLMVFIIANVLFTKNIKEALEASKYRERVLWGENEKLRQNDPNIAKYETVIIEVQKQKLLLALERIENQHRDELNFSYFISRYPNTNEMTYKMEDLFLGDEINERFKDSCISAQRLFLDREKLKQEWHDRIPDLEPGLVYNNTSIERSVVVNPEVITQENEMWLFQTINTRIEGIYAECCDMQSMALSCFYQHYIENPQLLKGTEIDKRLSQVFSASKEEKPRLISQLSRELHQYIKSLFNKQNVPLLENI